ncbi:hypothetical protein, partial [Pseudomonas amygdali]|uniref:hypothetical protein n=1 Tax=Pseudomonas amygdali TaxID=47877 RepID=UPI0019D37829
WIVGTFQYLHDFKEGKIEYTVECGSHKREMDDFFEAQRHFQETQKRIFHIPESNCSLGTMAIRDRTQSLLDALRI